MWEASQHLPNIYHKNLIVLQSDVLGRPRAHVRRPRDVQENVQGTSKGRPRGVQGTFHNTNSTNTNDSNSKSTKGTGKGCFVRAPSDSRSSWTSKVPLLYNGAFAMHMCATRPISSHCQDTQTSCRTLNQGFKVSRIQNLKDSKLKDSSTQGFTRSGTQEFMDGGLNGSGSSSGHLGTKAYIQNIGWLRLRINRWGPNKTRVKTFDVFFLLSPVSAK